MSGQRTIDRPKVRKRSGPSIVWLIPVVTLLVGGWLIVKTISERGPEATIAFRTAEGIEAGKTMVKYKDVDIGMVESIQFSGDFSNVVLTVRFNHGTDHFLRRNTRFWVVRPQLSLRGARGLGTLLSGSHIEIDPGPGAPQTHFIGLEQQPLITADELGRQVMLVTDHLGSIDAGSPIYYRGILAGEVLGHELGSDRRTIYIPAFIRAPYDQLIRGNTRFWNVSGMELSMGADGPSMKIESVLALLYGGISFDTPPSLGQPDDAAEDLVFALYRDQRSIADQAFTRKLNFVMYFESSVRGLSIGAPVEFKGIRIGTVLDVRLEVNPEDASFRIPVLVEVEPERIIDSTTSTVDPEQVLQGLVERGLRAKLQTGSLLTGQLYVELNMYPDSELVVRGDGRVPYPELPTVGGGFESILASVESFVGQLEGIDINAIGMRLAGTLEGTERIFNSPEMQQIIVDLEASMGSLRNILRQVDESNVDQAIEAARGVLRNIELLLQPSAPLHYNAVRVTNELEETARAIRALVELLERRPQALIFGPGKEE